MLYNKNNSFEEQNMNTDSKAKNIDKSFKKFDLKKYITVRNILSVIGFILLCILYYHSEMSSRAVSKSKEVFTIASHQFTYSSLAGVYTSIMTIILISMVLFYRRFGFCTAMLILTLRTMRLTRTFLNNHYHASMLPAIFTTIAAVVSVLLIYFQYEKMRKYQEKHRKEHEELTKEIIGAFSNCIDGKDSYTNGHSQRVAKYTRMLAQRLGESKENIEKYYNIALLHDIGKIGIPESILTKPGKLTDEEFSVMKSHAARGYEILKDIKIQEDIAAGAHHHHERFDGKGYPDGLSGTNIPWVARIISVADTFDAMSSNRPYRKKLPLEYIVAEIENCASSQFDPLVVKAFLSLYLEGAFSNLT